MRNLNTLPEHARRDRSPTVRDLYGFIGDETCGAFVVRKATPNGPIFLRVIATSGEGWDHVSVSLPARCPTWEEMAFIARVFFEDHETPIQIRPALSNYVNVHPYCLHWWRPTDQAVPLPPTDFV